MCSQKIAGNFLGGRIFLQSVQLDAAIDQGSYNTKNGGMLGR